MQYFWVGLGGALGSMLRFFLQTRMDALYSGVFPLGTLIVNLAGSFSIGLVGGFFSGLEAPLWFKSFLVIGILGGFTTFSAFAQGNLVLMRAGQMKMALLYIISTNALGIGLAFVGYLGARFFFASTLNLHS